MIERIGRDAGTKRRNGKGEASVAIVDGGHALGENGRSLASGYINGHGPGTAVAVNLLPDAHESVIAAVQAAAARGLPLASAGRHGARWPGEAAAELNGLGSIDIVRALAGIAPRMAAVEAEIERLITTPVKLVADIAAHTLGAGGKRLRPALALLCAQLCGDAGEEPDPRVVTCAAAIELTHTTTLLHDDVVDDAQTRRGKPAANLIWGSGTSVLVGDFLFAQVFVTASQRGFGDLMHPLARATAEMCAGELLETQLRGDLEMTERQYCEIIALKTASLIECACRLGAMAAGGGQMEIERLARFGRDLGMAFQIVDDVFDVVATQGRIGKPVGQDIREGGVTLPLLRALQVCPSHQREELGTIIGKEPIGDEEVARALTIVRATDAVQHAIDLATAYANSAKTQLSAFPPGPALDMLLDVTDYVMTREK